MKIPLSKLYNKTFMVTGFLMLIAFISFCIPTQMVRADSPVFINEIHYDNVDTDVNEGIEIAGPAGTNLAGWSLVLYNGNGGTVYGTESLTGVIPDQQDGFGTLTFMITSIQNGAPDGMALVAPGDTVIQFLSYEGAFAATAGTANGMASTDIGVTEGSSTLETESLQLEGTGMVYEDFSWTGPIASTMGNVNTGQSFTAMAASIYVTKDGPTTAVVGDTFTYTLLINNASGVAASNVILTDSLPLSLTVGTISDSGAIVSGNTVRWTLAALAVGEMATRTVSVQAPTVNTVVTNTDYTITTAEGVTTTVGSPVVTNIVGEPDTIADARGRIGDIVTLSGRATMYTGGFYAGSNSTNFYIQDATGGISVQCFGSSGTLPDVTLGDFVTVMGKIGNYNNEIQIVPTDNEAGIVITNGTPEDVPAPLDISVRDVLSETYLGWLVQVAGKVTNIYISTYNYQLSISDGVSTTLIYVDRNTGIDIQGIYVGRSYKITGIAEKNYSTAQVMPRIQSDIEDSTESSLFIRKEGPAQTLENVVYTYTLVASNTTTETLHNIIIDEELPAANAMVNVVGDGGMLAGDAISWTRATLDPDENWAVHFSVQVTGTVGDQIVNATYTVSADEWLSPSVGPPVETTITGGCTPGYTPVYDIQGNGDATPLNRSTTITTCGIVIGVAPGLSGFFIQDPVGDGDSTTSNGLFIYRGSQDYSDVKMGDLVEVMGRPSEYYDVTQLSASYYTNKLTIWANDLPLPASVSLTPPADAAQVDAYMEPLEGMWVSMPATVTVVAPTNAYGEYGIVRGDLGISRLIKQMNPDTGHIVLTDDGIVYDDRVAGDILSGIIGPLHYTYEEWKLEQAWSPEVMFSAMPPAFPNISPADSDQLSVGAFNMYNFDGEDTALKLTKLITDIHAMGGPLFLSLEEITVVDTWNLYDGYTVTGVIDDLLAGLTTLGYNYSYAYSHADGGGHGVAVLYDADRVTLNEWTTLQGCSADGSVDTATYDPVVCPVGEYPLFSRRPVVVNGTVSYNGVDTTVIFIGAHFKSQDDASADRRRLGQATLVAEYAAQMQAQGQNNVVVAGDLNDFMNSDVIQMLENTGKLTDMFYHLPIEQRYSYIYNGVSQVLDHILVSAPLWQARESFQPLHINADYPSGWETSSTTMYRSSDHDPVIALLDLNAVPDLSMSKAVEPESNVGAQGIVTYTIMVQNTGLGTAMEVVVSDVLPPQLAFLDWVTQPTGATGSGRNIQWTGDIGGDTTETLVFTAQVQPNTFIAPLTITNTATFVSENAGTGSASVTFDVAPPALSIEKLVEPATGVTPGDTVTYTIVLNNLGGGTAQNVTMHDNLPAQVQFQEWVMQPEGATGAEWAVDWTGALNAGTDVTFIFTAHVLEETLFVPLTITNTATYESSDAGSGSASAAFTMLAPGVSLTKSVVPMVEVPLSSVVTYTLTLENSTATPANGVVLTDILPDAITFGEWVGGIPDGTEYNDGTITWEGTLAADQTLTVVFTATLNNNTDLYRQTITNTASFISANDGSGEANAAFTVEIGTRYVYLPLVMRS